MRGVAFWYGNEVAVPVFFPVILLSVFSVIKPKRYRREEVRGFRGDRSPYVLVAVRYDLVDTARTSR